MNSFKSCLLILSLVLVGVSCKKDTEDIENAVPVVNAGLSKSITLPVNSVTLTGSAADADGQVVAYLWSQVSGPFPATIANPGSASTLISGFVQGTYVFQLMATDNMGATGVDTALVIVNPAVQQTLTVQPTNNPNEKMLVNIGGADFSSTNSELVIDAWTTGGSPYTGRAVFKFDLNNIPTNSTIISANLFLYSNTPPENGNLIDANFGSSNSLLLQRITSSWSPASASWFNQPTATIASQVVIPHTALSALDLNIDVTNLVGTMVNSNANYGFLLRLENEVIYNSRMFVSSYHATKTQKHPKLVVVYQ